MQNSPDEKHLQTTSFVIHATRGLVRDQNMRRKAMFVLVAAALTLLICGSTFLQTILNPREHPGWFLVFWVACGWLALTAMALAVFDLLLTRLEARRQQRQLRAKLKTESLSDE